MTSLAPLRESAAFSGRTEDLHALLVGYAGILKTIDDAPPVPWARPERPPILRWLRFPASGALVRTLVVRHITRCVNALKRYGARRVALNEGAAGPLRELKMLESFEQSLPTARRLTVIAPLALLGVLLVAYILANYVIHTPASALLGDLTTAAVNLDRGAAIDAFKTNPTELAVYLGAAAIVTYSVMLVILPLLPAFTVERRLLEPSAGLETSGFAALGCPRVYDFELDLLGQLLLIVPVGLFGIDLLVRAWGLPPVDVGIAAGWTSIAVIFGAIALAGVELLRCYRGRRTGAVRRHTRITRAALWVVDTGSVLLLVAMLLGW